MSFSLITIPAFDKVKIKISKQLSYSEKFYPSPREVSQLLTNSVEPFQQQIVCTDCRLTETYQIQKNKIILPSRRLFSVCRPCSLKKFGQN
jgi:hypothetical protein